jgi:uncharacterized protein YjiS (DUF1127 family)
MSRPSPRSPSPFLPPERPGGTAKALGARLEEARRYSPQTYFDARGLRDAAIRAALGCLWRGLKRGSRRLAALPAGIGRVAALYRQRRALLALDDRMLGDIGASRADAAREAAALAAAAREGLRRCLIRAADPPADACPRRKAASSFPPQP